MNFSGYPDKRLPDIAELPDVARFPEPIGIKNISALPDNLPSVSGRFQEILTISRITAAGTLLLIRTLISGIAGRVLLIAGRYGLLLIRTSI